MSVEGEQQLLELIVVLIYMISFFAGLGFGGRR